MSFIVRRHIEPSMYIQQILLLLQITHAIVAAVITTSNCAGAAKAEAVHAQLFAAAVSVPISRHYSAQATVEGMTGDTQCQSLKPI